MNPLLTAFIKVNLSVALFYLFYKLLFDKDTFLSVKRIYLLTALIFSMLLPFIDLTSIFHAEIKENIQNGTIVLPEFYVTPASNVLLIPWMKILVTTYLLVTTFFLLKMLSGVFSFLKFKKNSIPANFHQFRYFSVNQEIAPFSFFNQIFINPELHSPREMVEILVHEDTHARQGHSFDVLLAETVASLLWMNPMVWMIKKDIRTNLEFIADKKVLNAGFDSKNYQFHLLKLSYDCTEFTLTNSFNISPIKKRIAMMNKSQTRKPAMLKYVLVAPLTLALVMLSNLETIAANAQIFLQNALPETATINTNIDENAPEIMNVKESESANESIIETPVQDNKKTQPVQEKPEKVSQDETVFMVVETMPSYPGGDVGLVTFLTQNIKYPVEAAKKGIQGRVICQFVIERDGSIQEVSVVRSVDPELDAEAIRVIKAMPKWTPGTQKGETVRVKYTLPINFRLDEDKKNPKTESSTDPSKQPVYLVNGERLPEGMNISNIKPETIEKIDVTKPENDTEKAKLISKYGPSGANGVVNITLKK